MAYNLDNLKNIPPYEVNTSRIGNGTDVPANIINYTRDALVDLWINGIGFVAFIALLWYFTEKKNFNIYQGTLISSAFVFSLISGVLLSGWSKNIYPLILYGTIMLISAILVYINKKKGFN